MTSAEGPGTPEQAAEPEKATKTRGPQSRFVVAALLVAAVLMAAGGVLGLVRAHQLRSVAAADNLALVDTAESKQVGDAVDDGLTRILTFDHADPDATKQAAEEVLTGKAQDEYDELFAALLDQTASQQLTLTTQVKEVGVKELTPDHAELLVFLDQSSTRATDGEQNLAAAQLAVTAVKKDGTWLISGLDPL